MDMDAPRTKLDIVKSIIFSDFQCLPPRSWRVLRPDESDPDQRRIIEAEGFIEAYCDNPDLDISGGDGNIVHHLVISSAAPLMPRGGFYKKCDRSNVHRFKKTETGGLLYFPGVGNSGHIRQFHFCGMPDERVWGMVRMAAGVPIKIRLTARLQCLEPPDPNDPDGCQAALFAEFTGFDKSNRCIFLSGETAEIRMAGEVREKDLRAWKIPMTNVYVGLRLWTYSF